MFDSRLISNIFGTSVGDHDHLCYHSIRGFLSDGQAVLKAVDLQSCQPNNCTRFECVWHKCSIAPCTLTLMMKLYVSFKALYEDRNM